MGIARRRLLISVTQYKTCSPAVARVGGAVIWAEEKPVHGSQLMLLRLNHPSLLRYVSQVDLEGVSKSASIQNAQR
jgi:hypothetical protein